MANPRTISYRLRTVNTAQFRRISQTTKTPAKSFWKESWTAGFTYSGWKTLA